MIGWLAQVRDRLREPSSLAALAVGIAMLKDWMPLPFLWYAANGIVGVVILAAVLVPERK